MSDSLRDDARRQFNVSFRASAGGDVVDLSETDDDALQRGSSSRNKIDADALAGLVAVTGVSEARAVELLEAVGGCVDKAADLHFCQQTDAELEIPTATTKACQIDDRHGEAPILQASESTVSPDPPQLIGHDASETIARREKRRRQEHTTRRLDDTVSSFFASSKSSRSGDDGGAARIPQSDTTTHDDEASVVDGSPAARPSDVCDKMIGTKAATSAACAHKIAQKGHEVSDSPRSGSAPSKSGSIPYNILSSAFAKLCATTKRKEKDVILQQMFRAILEQSADDLIPAVYLSSNHLGPPWEALDVGIGGAAINSAISTATGTTSRELSALWKQHGDPGDVAAVVRGRQRLLMQPAILTVRRVYDTLRSFCSMTGEGCTTRRVNAMVALIRAARCREESRFLVRTFAFHLRTQATLTTVKDAAVAAIVEHRAACRDRAGGEQCSIAEAQRAARECFTSCPDVRRMLEGLLRDGVAGMRKNCSFAVGTPMRPMLARADTSVDAVLSATGGAAVACEHKYDGQRAQIHRNAAGNISIFSRHLEDMTSKFPDVASRLRGQCLDAQGQMRPFVLDAEIVAVGDGCDDSIAGATGPASKATAQVRSDAFQRLSTRKRKDVTISSIDVAVRVFAFDLLYIDADKIVDRSFRDRRRILHESFVCTEAFAFASYVDINDEGLLDEKVDADSTRSDRMQEALDRSLADNCEGLMCKLLDAPYEPSDGSKRSAAWIKLKADYIEGMGDSLDLVPIGGWHGLGRKARWISPFLLACWDPETESLQSVCRVLSGFTDAYYADRTAFYLGTDANCVDGEVHDREKAANCDVSEDLQSGRRRLGPDPRVVTGESPPLWFEPSEVWEIKGASISLSPKHKAGIGILHPERGLSLRFPRFIRQRTDKRVEDATTASQLAAMFQRQQVGGPSVEGERGASEARRGGASQDDEIDED
eukprot:TRINITY_DN30949_c0_g1_i1.p1 TRINITY_DN30949_c0_g1~~TRINITY_DN30949_c0_g1_i1.p1  ORF type:complete len:948 (+),score=151.89 TRINITY_DN30949_c0_g1_i1:25-2844(+)